MTKQYETVLVPGNVGIRNGEWEAPFDGDDPPLFDKQLRYAVELSLEHDIPLILSGADTGRDHLETEARNYLSRLSKIAADLPVSTLQIVLEEDARSSAGNLFSDLPVLVQRTVIIPDPWQSSDFRSSRTCFDRPPWTLDSLTAWTTSELPILHLGHG
jgi:hypothetical protein